MMEHAGHAESNATEAMNTYRRTCHFCNIELKYDIRDDKLYCPNCNRVYHEELCKWCNYGLCKNEACIWNKCVCPGDIQRDCLEKPGEEKEEKSEASEEQSDNNPVEHPNHYCQGGIECIKAIEASMSPEGFQDYCKGNVMKYIWRWREKNGLEDLKKARVYLNWLIESKEKQDAE